MKKLKNLIFICFFSFMATHSIGQRVFYAKGAMNINTLVEVNEPEGAPKFYSSYTSYGLSAFGVTPLSTKLQLIMELEYAQRGAKYTNPFNNKDSKIKLNYIGVPILLSYVLFPKMNLDLGINAAYKISAVAVEEGTKKNANKAFKNDIDLGIISGLRYGVGEKLMIVARYYYGITPVVKATYYNIPNNTYSTSTFHNSSIQFGLCYTLKLKSKDKKQKPKKASALHPFKHY